MRRESSWKRTGPRSPNKCATVARTGSVQFGNSRRAELRYDDCLGATTEEIERSARGYFAYCGTYELRGNEVIHRIEWSLMPNWIGGEQRRFWKLEGDTLTITTPPLLLEGRPQASTLIWERV